MSKCYWLCLTSIFVWSTCLRIHPFCLSFFIILHMTIECDRQRVFRTGFLPWISISQPIIWLFNLQQHIDHSKPLTSCAFLSTRWYRYQCIKFKLSTHPQVDLTSHINHHKLNTMITSHAVVQLPMANEVLITSRKSKITLKLVKLCLLQVLLLLHFTFSWFMMLLKRFCTCQSLNQLPV